ncbi:MAG: hypothetical protein NC095_01630 [Muribaculum sp.]|nr:hypothetical protein [Muribaculum sp.]
MRYISHLKNSSEKFALAAYASSAVLVSATCGNKTTSVGYDSVAQEEIQFHADNDIAMTVRSIVDAVRVGETLMPDDYDFDGVLTDGQGTPLYTDLEGAPGQWRVKVVGDEEAEISNRYIGDLMDDDLRIYILGALNLNDADLISAYKNPSNEDEFIYHYDTGDIDINFSTLPAVSASGLEGTLMTISISKKPGQAST